MKFSPYAWSVGDMIGGNAALDFVNTVSKWNEEPVDRLGGPADFANWARLAGLVDAAGVSRIQKEISGDSAAAQKLYESASDLRAALWRIFSRLPAGRTVANEDLAVLAGWTRRAAERSTLAPTAGGGFERRWTEDASDLERPVLAIAQAAESLLENGPLDRLHVCGGGSCQWMFVDLSKNARRRWCSMATCGNDAKVKKFRSRKRKAAAA